MIPSSDSALLSVPPLMTYGTGIPSGSWTKIAAHIASTRSPSKSTSSAMSRVMVSISISGPMIDLIVELSSSSYPGKNLPSMTAEADAGITFSLYPASNIVGLAVFCNVAPTIRAVGPISANKGVRSAGLNGLPVACAIFSKRILTVFVYLWGHWYRPILATASVIKVIAFSSFNIEP